MRSSSRTGRILHVISVLSVGGVEVWLIELLRHMRALADEGREVEQFDILMTGGSRGELDDLAASLGANLHYLRFARPVPIQARHKGFHSHPGVRS